MQFVGIFAVNAASIKPLFSTSRWLNSSKGNNSNSNNNKISGNTDQYSHPLVTIGRKSTRQNLSSKQRQEADLDGNSSEEHIVKASEYGGGFQNNIRAGSTASGQGGHPDGIVVTTTYEVSPYKSTLDV